RGHLGIAEDAGPFAEGEIGGDDDRSALVEAADEGKEELAARLGERKVANLVQDDEGQAGEMISEATLASIARLGLEPIDEIDDIVKPAAASGPDAASGDGDGKMGLAGAGAAD